MTTADLLAEIDRSLSVNEYTVADVIRERQLAHRMRIATGLSAGERGDARGGPVDIFAAPVVFAETVEHDSAAGAPAPAAADLRPANHQPGVI